MFNFREHFGNTAGRSVYAYFRLESPRAQQVMLLPGSDSAMRAKLVRWFDKHKLRPRIVGEFDGSSLMAAFGETGFGVFAAPSVLAEELRARHGVVQIAATREIVAEYFAISVERRLTHPCVQAITEAARRRILKPVDIKD